MILSRHGKEYLELTLSTTPAVDGWEATFDDGDTWTAGTEVTVGDETRYRWLLAGSLADTTDAVAVLEPGIHVVVVRATSNPEIIARSGDPIGPIAVT